MSRRNLISESALTQERLKQLVRYDSETGFFFRIHSCGPVKGGSKAGSISADGYLSIQLDGFRYLSHRLAWLYIYGKWPKAEIDHINCMRSDNRISNLRSVTATQNAQNKKKPNANNKTGYLGVFKCRDRFWAAIQVDSKNIYLGAFRNPEDAHAAYLEAKRRLHSTCTI